MLQATMVNALVTSRVSEANVLRTRITALKSSIFSAAARPDGYAEMVELTTEVDRLEQQLNAPADRVLGIQSAFSDGKIRRAIMPLAPLVGADIPMPTGGFNDALNAVQSSNAQIQKAIEKAQTEASDALNRANAQTRTAEEQVRDLKQQLATRPTFAAGGGGTLHAIVATRKDTLSWLKQQVPTSVTDLNVAINRGETLKATWSSLDDALPVVNDTGGNLGKLINSFRAWIATKASKIDVKMKTLMAALTKAEKDAEIVVVPPGPPKSEMVIPATKDAVNIAITDRIAVLRNYLTTTHNCLERTDGGLNAIAGIVLNPDNTVTSVGEPFESRYNNAFDGYEAAHQSFVQLTADIAGYETQLSGLFGAMFDSWLTTFQALYVDFTNFANKLDATGALEKLIVDCKDLNDRVVQLSKEVTDANVIELAKLDDITKAATKKEQSSLVEKARKKRDDIEAKQRKEATQKAQDDAENRERLEEERRAREEEEQEEQIRQDELSRGPSVVRTDEQLFLSVLDYMAMGDTKVSAITNTQFGSQFPPAMTVTKDNTKILTKGPAKKNFVTNMRSLRTLIGTRKVKNPTAAQEKNLREFLMISKNFVSADINPKLERELPAGILVNGSWATLTNMNDEKAVLRLSTLGTTASVLTALKQGNAMAILQYQLMLDWIIRLYGKSVDAAADSVLSRVNDSSYVLAVTTQRTPTNSVLAMFINLNDLASVTKAASATPSTKFYSPGLIGDSINATTIAVTTQESWSDDDDAWAHKF